MKNILLLMFGVVTLSSCLNNKEEVATYKYWGVVKVDKSLDLGYKLLLDNDQVVVPVSSDYKYEAKNRDRKLFFFEMADGSTVKDSIIYAKMKFADKFLISDLVTQASTAGMDTLGTDGVAVFNGSVWHAKNLLNVPFIYEKAASFPKKHSFNLVYFPDSLYQPDPKNNPELVGVYMELRHNANKDKDDVKCEGYKCFDLNSISRFANVQDSIPYIIKINSGGFDGAVSAFTGWYHKPDVIR